MEKLKNLLPENIKNVLRGLLSLLQSIRFLLLRLEYVIFSPLFSVLKTHFYATPHYHGPRKRVTVGKRVSLANAILNTRGGRIDIKDDVILGHNVMILTGAHDYKLMDQHRPSIDENRHIVIENNVWIASGAILIGPVKIGRNTVIGAGSIVTKDIPEGVLAAGNPAVVIKQLKK